MRRSPLPLTKWVTAADVMEAVGCSRSAAYEYLHRAAGTGVRTGRAVRVTVEQWERYARVEFGRMEAEDRCISDEEPTSTMQRSMWTVGALNGARGAPRKRRLGPFCGSGSTKPLIPVVQPRTRR
jgi:hypothetical protein